MKPGARIVITALKLKSLALNQGAKIRTSKQSYGRAASDPNVERFINPNDIVQKKTSMASLPKPIVIFCGDGVSDISAAREADILFAKRGLDLEHWCKLENIPYTAFDRFNVGRPCVLVSTIWLTR